MTFCKRPAGRQVQHTLAIGAKLTPTALSFIPRAPGKIAMGRPAATDKIGGVNSLSPLRVAPPVSTHTLTTLAAADLDPFATIQAIRAIEAHHFPHYTEADFGTFLSDVSLALHAPRGLALVLDAERAVKGYCWLMPFNEAGEARLLRGERDGGIAPAHLVTDDQPMHGAAVYLASVAVHPSLIGAGFGARLLHHAAAALDHLHPKCLLQTAWSAWGAGLLKPYAPVQVGRCGDYPIYRAAWKAAALPTAA